MSSFKVEVSVHRDLSGHWYWATYSHEQERSRGDTESAEHAFRDAAAALLRLVPRQEERSEQEPVVSEADWYVESAAPSLITPALAQLLADLDADDETEALLRPTPEERR